MIVIKTPEQIAIPHYAAASAHAANGLPPSFADVRHIGVNRLIADVREVPFGERDGGHSIPRALGDIATMSVDVQSALSEAVLVPVDRR